MKRAITVVIPTHQRPRALARCLEFLAQQTFPREQFQVVVTDDSRDFSTRDMVREKFPWALWTEGPRRGPAANRNHGAKQARGEWIVFIDDDCEPAPGWLAAIAVNDDVDVIEGKTICPSERDTPFEERVENLRGGVFWSCNLAVRRSVFERLRGFDEDFLEAGGEDMEFASRLANNRLRTRFVTGAQVVHPARAISWKQLWRRTWLIRWILFYRLKTGQSAPLKTSWLRALAGLARVEMADLLRTTLQFFLKFDRRFWRANLFRQCWKWLTFPLVLPYLMFWEIRFRKQLQAGPRPDSAG